jgi:aspartyl-tRNA(Asn)/glutamyl-tRNA(Gln) amidotransferase subunit A
LAYGITGENPEYGDCGQPKNPARLTGGSSSGAAASVQEGSALAAIGTDTGGSIRVPAAICGLAGYRSSLGKGFWSGGAHLAQSFDTIGWLYRNLEDGPLLGMALFDLPSPEEFRWKIRAAVVSSGFLEDCDEEVLSSLQEFGEELKGLEAEVSVIDIAWWTDLREIFAGIQAHEAAKIHAGHFDAFEPAIRDRLLWGASLSDEEVARMRVKHEQIRERMATLLRQYDIVVLPAAPVGVLASGADHSTTRQRLLRYTVPASLAGIPVVTVPMPVGGMQLLAAWGKDSELLGISAEIGKHRRS